jgi:hypothetical protein
MSSPLAARWSSLAASVLSAAVLCACAAAVPGYVPPTDNPSSFSKLKKFDAGDVTDAGVYQPSAAERDLDCRRLLGSMRIIISRLQDQPNRPRPGVLAATAQMTAKSVTGRPGIDLSAEEQRERARLVAFNKLLGEKKCQTLDLDAELAAKPAPAAPAATYKRP